METSLIWLDYRCDVCESNQTCWSAWPMPDKYLIHFSNVLRFFKSQLWRAPWAGSLWTLTGIDSRGLLMKQQRWRFMGWAFGPLKSSWWSPSNVIGASSPRSDTLLRVSWSIQVSVWHCICNCVLLNFEFFFLLKLSVVCTFWIVLMCWCQKWFLKNKKTSLACISAWKAIWKAPATTLSNTH